MTTTALLGRFVAPITEERTYLRGLLREGGWLLATNGAIVVRVPNDPTVVAADCHLNFGLIFSSEAVTGINPVALPDLPRPIPCQFCLGTGQGYLCSACLGDGEVDGDGLSNNICESCDGEGRLGGPPPVGVSNAGCWCCQAMGTLQQRVVIEGVGYDARLLAKIVDLPGITFMIPKGSTDSATPSRFWFSLPGGGTGEGALMPLRA